MLIENNRPPDFINAQGVKWWIDEDTKRYADNKNVEGDFWVVELPSGEVNRIMTVNGNVVFETKKLEDIGVYIDRVSIYKNFNG